MANEIDIDLGSFNLDSTNYIAVADINIKVAKSLKESALPKNDGAVSPAPKRGPIQVTIKGTIIGSNYDALRTNLDALKAAMESASEQKLTLDDDRYIMVKYSSFSYGYKSLRTFADFSFSLSAADPFWYSETLTSAETTPTSGVGFTVNNPGNAPTRVKITLTNNDSGSGSSIIDDIKVENTTTGEKFQYLGTLVAAKALIVNNRMDQSTLAVTNDGTNDIKDFEGDFITLNPGDNTIVLTTSGSSLALKREYRAAYY